MGGQRSGVIPNCYEDSETRRDRAELVAQKAREEAGGYIEMERRFPMTIEEYTKKQIYDGIVNGVLIERKHCNRALSNCKKSCREKIQKVSLLQARRTVLLKKLMEACLDENVSTDIFNMVKRAYLLK